MDVPLLRVDSLEIKELIVGNGTFLSRWGRFPRRMADGFEERPMGKEVWEFVMVFS
jgi:hypothetical protein